MGVLKIYSQTVISKKSCHTCCLYPGSGKGDDQLLVNGRTETEGQVVTHVLELGGFSGSHTCPPPGPVVHKGERESQNKESCRKIQCGHMSKKQSTSQSPSTEDTLDNSEQDEIHQAAAVICDALGSFEDRQMSSPRGRGRGSERRSSSENLSVKIARAFFQAATVKSGDDEDILPQEDGPDEKLSVYYLFSELFPDHVNNMVCSEGGSKNGLTRLQVDPRDPTALPLAMFDLDPPRPLGQAAPNPTSENLYGFVPLDTTLPQICDIATNDPLLPCTRVLTRHLAPPVQQDRV